MCRLAILLNTPLGTSANETCACVRELGNVP